MNSGIFVGALLAATAAPALAQEHVLFEVQGKDTVLGTIRPSDEREAILGNLVAGTTVKASVKAKQKTGPVPELQLLLGGVPVPGAQVATKGRGSVLAPFVVTADGLYKVVVLGDGVKDGDYELAVTWTAQKSFAGTGTSAGDTTFAFSAPADSVATISLAAAKSAFVPHLAELDGPDAAVVALPGGGRAAGVRLAKRGDWTLHFRSDGAEGAYRVTVKVAPPKVGKHRSDIRDSALAGAFTGGSNVFGAVVLPGDGGTVDVGSSGTPIDGASVTIPPDSLGQTTSIFVAQATPYTPPGAAHPAGPAVEFGPSGTQFDPGKPATVTIPYDPDAFPGGTGALVVYVKDAKGVVSAVLPTSAYVFGTNTVTFTTSHFSTFEATTSADRGTPTANYTWIDVTGAPSMSYAGEFGVGYGSALVKPGIFGSQLTRSSVMWDPGGARPPSARLDSFDDGVSAGTVQQFGDSSFDVADQFGQPVARLRRGLTDDVFVVEHKFGSTQLGTAVLLRRVDSRPSLGALAGKWHAFVWEAAAAASPAAGASTIPLAFTADAGSATITPAGDVTFRFSSRVKRSTDLPSGEWRRETSSGLQAHATISVDSIDYVTAIAFGTEQPTELSICAGGDVVVGKLVGVDRGSGVADVQVALLMLVRESSGASAAGLAGDYVDVMGGIDLRAADGNPAPDPLGAEWRAETGTTTLGTDATRVSSITLCQSHSVFGDPLSNYGERPTTPPAPFAAGASGTFSVPSLSLSGAAVRAGEFLVYLRRDPLTQGIGFAVRLPPQGS